MFVLNVAGVVDLTPVKDFQKYIIISFADIVLRKIKPSRKSSAT